MSSQIVYYLALVPTILMAITFHEYAHARVALWCGDRTPYDQGRVTLNPLAHLDPMGTIMIFLVGFGWGRPVQVNPSNFNHPRADALVSAAGPCTNFLLAIIASVGLRLVAPYVAIDALTIYMVSVFVTINLALGLFNLIPLFPLDGSHVLENLLPVKHAATVQQFNRRYGVAILLSIVLLSYVTPIHLFGMILGPPMTFLRQLLLGF